MKSKLKYFLTCIKKKMLQEGSACPSCGYSRSKLVKTKYIVSALRRCNNCNLLFRAPVTTEKENSLFYQEEYSQGYTTDCPSDALLEQYLQTGFKGAEGSFPLYNEVIMSAGGKKGDSLFDFGCSWGYGSWQLQKFGFNVEAFEISEPRANFARDKLNINVHKSLSSVKNKFDIFFSSHVLEHVPSVNATIEFGMSILKKDGIFIAFTPNGSEEYRKNNFNFWNKAWGMVHPNFLDPVYYKSRFAKKQHLISSNPYPIEKIKNWKSESKSNNCLELEIDGNELLVIVKK